MRTKSFILGGIAVAGLIGSTPVFAFTHHPGTLAEHQQTEALNQQQLDQARGTQTASAMTGTPADQQANAAAAPAQTAQAGADQQANAAAAPAPAQTAQAGTPVDSLSNPPQALANASVETNNGQAVGAVQRVITDATGKAKTVIVALLGGVNKLVAIAANELNFDESRNVVVAQMSADQINALPAAPQG